MLKPKRKAIDPVCNMEVDTTKTHFKTVQKGVTYYFCSAHCKATFEAHKGMYA